MKRLYSAASLPEAHLLLHRLLAKDIAAQVFNENAQGGVGELPFTHAYPEVWIECEEDEIQARMIVQQFEGRPDTGPDADCPNCGELNPTTFEICWRCAAPLSV